MSLISFCHCFKFCVAVCENLDLFTSMRCCSSTFVPCLVFDPTIYQVIWPSKFCRNYCSLPILHDLRFWLFFFYVNGILRLHIVSYRICLMFVLPHIIKFLVFPNSVAVWIFAAWSLAPLPLSITIGIEVRFKRALNAAVGVVLIATSIRKSGLLFHLWSPGLGFLSRLHSPVLFVHYGPEDIVAFTI